MTTAYDAIAHLSPCVEAAEWLKTQSDAQTAWNNCQRGDWMMWLLSKTGVDQRISVILACRFARMALQYTDQTDNRSITAITAAEAWLANPCEDTRAAARAAAARAAAARAAAAAARAAAARAAAAADDAAAAAAARAAYADAAYAASAYAAAAAAAYADAAAYAEQANIIREIIPVIVL